MKSKRKKILVALSGGVDSALAAKLLKDQGHQVAAVFLRFWKDETDPNQAENSCCSLQSFLDAKQVAAKIGIPIFSFDYSLEFKKNVVDYFLKEYSLGLTPNPCVVCNKYIKLGKLLKQAKALDYDFLASGHYIKTRVVKDKVYVYKAKDKTKDQSYFLYTLSNDEFKSLIFPLADLKKEEVRKLAAKYDLKVANKSDSQDICFLSGPHNNFLKRHLKLKPGEIRTLKDNKKIAYHQGLPLYTIGQRRGINVGGTGPYYVAKFDYKKNILYVVNNFADAVLYSSEFQIRDYNFLIDKKDINNLKCQVVIRYGHLAIDCKLEFVKNRVKVLLSKPSRAITPGQSAVFYIKNRLIGGGVIV